MLNAVIPEGPATRDDFFAYGGGLDLVTPDLQKPPGVLIDCVNWEIPADGGYRRGSGYEGCDGRPRPSEASATTLQSATTISVSVAVGDTVNGQTSGATGQVIYIAHDRSWLAVTKVASAFSIGENLRKSTTVVGVITTFTASVDGDTSNRLSSLAAAVYRADITAVPGEGPVRGIWYHVDKLYAWRNNVGSTACVMHVATSSGWTAVTLAEEVRFTDANTNVGVGDTLTQGGVTATIRRVIVQTGTLVSGTNTGKLVITGRAGGNLAAGAATSTGGGTLTISGAQTAQGFPAGGKYGFRSHNFAGAAPTFRVYGWNGVGRAFEFDGTYLAFIDTGMAADTPLHGEVHTNRLFLTFDSSLQVSGPGDPHAWSAVVGAAEWGAGATITGVMSAPGSDVSPALYVFTRNRTFVLYGKDSSTWNMVTALPEVGARAYSIQNLRDTVFLDDLGLTSVGASDRFGNFADADLSAKIAPYVSGRIESTSCSVVVRKEGQYKLFFTDGAGVTATFKAGKLVGMTPFVYPHVMNVACEAEKDGGTMYAGGTDGMVYELNRGRGFDGQEINARMQLAFHYLRSPSLRKRMRRFRFDVVAPGYHSVNIGHAAGRFDPRIDAGSVVKAGTMSGGGEGFDSAVAGWDVLAFDGTQMAKLGIQLNLTATDVSIIFASNVNHELPFAVTGQAMQFTPRRIDRR